MNTISESNEEWAKRTIEEINAVRKDDLLRKINGFVQNVYRPYQVHKVLQEHAEALVQELKKTQSIEASSSWSLTVFEMLEIVVEEINRDVKEYENILIERVK